MLFDARIGRESGAFDQTLWKPLTDRRMLRTNPQWQLVSPDVPSLPLDAPSALPSILDLAPALLRLRLKPVRIGTGPLSVSSTRRPRASAPWMMRS